MDNIIDIEKEINNLNNKRKELIKEIKEIDIKINKLFDEKFGLDKNYVKIECRRCNTNGYIQTDKGKKPCDVCLGDKFVWAKIYNKKEK